MRALFYGLGADGTVGANKNSIKIIGEETDNFAQGYFVYDSKKSGAVTVSHLRFGPKPIRSTYLVRRANFVACHQEPFLDRYDMLEAAAPGAVFLLNTQYGPAEAWDELPLEMQEQILEKRLKVWVIDAYKVAKALGMGGRINTIMQTCFFAISGVLPREEAIAQIKKAIEKTYGKKGEETVRRNFAAVDGTLENLAEMVVPAKITSTRRRPPIVSDAAPDFVKRVSGVMLEGKGDLLPVSAFPPDGTWPLSTAQWEKRNIALEIPVWDEKICIQCNKCAMVCPHAAIRAKVFDPAVLKGAPKTYKSVPYKGTEYAGQGLHDPDRAGGLHGLHALRRRVPREGQVEPEAQVARHGAPEAPARRRARKLRLLPRPARSGPHDGPPRREGRPVPPAALRVLGRLLRLRRDPVREAPHAALRRPRAHRERHGVLVDLRRQPPDDPLPDERGRPRPGLVELALRGQRGVRPRVPPRVGLVPGPGADARESARPAHRRRRSPESF